MRFSIRDLLWATVVVAMGLGWWMEHQAHGETDAKRLEAVSQAQRHRTTLQSAKQPCLAQEKFVPRFCPFGPEMDWSVLYEPLVKP